MRTGWFCVCLLVPAISLAQQSGSESRSENTAAVEKASTPLPVKKVILYKNGVGYFEHVGQVRGNQDLGIDFTTAQLNDVLKSMTLVDLNGGKINTVRYNSVAPLSEQLKGLQIPLGEEVSSAALLTALRGTRVEVRSSAGVATGKIFSVETVEKAATAGANHAIHVTQLAIVTDTGEMRLFEIGPGVTVRTAEAEMQRDLNRYLNLMGSTRAKDLRRMTISANGTGERQVMVSYISEVPVWKSTYRIVLPKEPGHPFLQGWAIVDNTVGEDWKDVRLSLASGTPQSFVQNISQPYYTRRPVVALPESVMLTPQAHEETMMEARPGAMLVAPQLVPGGVAGGVPGGTVGGVMGGVIGGGAGAAPPAPGEEIAEEEITNALGGQKSEAQAALIGELFEYDLKDRITVMKNQSALVPIVQSPIDAERVTLIPTMDDGGVLQVPLRALWLRNTSGETLDGGTFNVLEQGSFAGEGLMELLHPDERRLLSYAADKAVRVTKDDTTGSRTTTRVTLVNGVMAMHREEREEAAYAIRNADTAPRQVILEYPIRSGWKLADGLKPEESSATRYRFRVTVAPGKTEKLTIDERKPEVARISISTLSENQVAAYVEDGTVKPELAAKLREVIAKKAEIFRVDQDIRGMQQQMDAIDKDQVRLRENMKALKGSPEEKALLQRYTRQLDGQEDQLASLQKEIGNLRTKRVVLQTELDTMVREIAVDETL